MAYNEKATRGASDRGAQVLPPAGATVPPWLPAKSAHVSNLPACCALGPRWTGSRRTGDTPIAGRSRTENGSRYRRITPADTQPSLPGLTRQSIANNDFFL